MESSTSSTEDGYNLASTLGKRAVDILVSQIEDESNKETLFLESRFIFTDSV